MTLEEENAELKVKRKQLEVEVDRLNDLVDQLDSRIVKRVWKDLQDARREEANLIELLNEMKKLVEQLTRQYDGMRRDLHG